MAFPSGTLYYIPITVNHLLVNVSASYYSYAVNLSSKLASDAIFKGYISSGSNIAVYDPSTDSTRPRTVYIDLTNNRLIIYFDSSTSTSIDKTYYICVGSSVSQANSTEAWTNSGFVYVWPIKEFSNGATSYEPIASYNLSRVSPATIGEWSAGLFGGCGVNYGTTAISHLILNPNHRVLPTGATRSIEFLVYIDGYGNNNLGRLIAAWPFMAYVWNGAGQQLRLTNNGYSTVANFPVSFDTWHHIIIVRNSDGNAWIYVDGVVSSTQYIGPAIQSDNFYLLGEWGAYAFDGRISDVGIINSTLPSNVASTRSNMFKSPATFWTIGTGEYFQYITANFSADDLSVAIGSDVNFTDLTVGYPAIDGWDWDLDDGLSSSEQNPTQHWDTAGLKTISLTAANDYGSDNETKTDYISVYQLEANFTISTFPVYQNQQMQFVNLSQYSGTLVSYDWDFGDGTPHSSDANPFHTYTTLGLKTVTLTLTTSDGTDIEIKTDYINVIVFIDGFSKITLVSSVGNISLDPPIYNYQVNIRFPFEYVPIECGTFALYDMGSLYDKRECICDFELTPQESASLNDFITATRGEVISLYVPQSSGFFPSGPDKGDSGTFTVAIERVKHRGMLNEPFRYFGDRLRFQFTESSSSSLPTQIPDGTLQIGSITDLRFPEEMFDPDHTFAYYTQLTEDSTAKFVDRGSLSDIRLTQFTLRSNTSKAAAIVNHLATVVRTNQTSIVAQSEHYPFGIADGDNQTFDAFLIQDTLSIRHNRFNEFEMQLRFLLEKHMAPSSPWFYTSPSEFLSHNNDGMQIWQ